MELKSSRINRYEASAFWRSVEIQVLQLPMVAQGPDARFSKNGWRRASHCQLHVNYNIWGKLTGFEWDRPRKESQNPHPSARFACGPEHVQAFAHPTPKILSG